MEAETRATRVYVSGPLSTGLFTENIVRAAEVGRILLDRGYAVYLPHANVLWELMQPMPVSRWLNHDFEWIRGCDALLRIDGRSVNGDLEVEWALAHKITVYYSLDTLFACEKPRRNV